MDDYKIWKEGKTKYFQKFISKSTAIPGRYLADDFSDISKDDCCKCKKPLGDKYDTKYYRHDYCGGMHSVFVYAYENNYCEKCAKELASHTYNDHISLNRETRIEDIKTGRGITYISSPDCEVSPEYDPECARVEDVL